MDPDLYMRRRNIERSRADPDGRAPGVVASIAASWRRSAGVDAAQPGAPVENDRADIADRWEQSPIRRAAADVLVDLEVLCTRERLVAGITDPDGRLLWTCGGADMRDRAEHLGFVPGSRWDEATVGTNAVALALRRREPVSVFAGEHWLEAAGDIVCYAAPLSFPDGTVAGALDFTLDWHRASNLGLLSVSATAQLIDNALKGLDLPCRAAGELQASLLGHPDVRWRGQRTPLSPRHSEIVAVLAFVDTATLDQLHAFLYGDRAVSITTLKVEVSRLRRQLRGAIGSRPYRLLAPTTIDAVELMAHLAAGRVSEAATLYRGQLLPASDAPLVVERRHVLDVALRSALLAQGDAAALLRYADVHPHDVTVLERAVAMAGKNGPLRGAALGRLATQHAG